MTSSTAVFGAVAIGGAVGSVLRYGMGLLVHNRLSGIGGVSGSTLGTLLVNVIGSFLIGFLFVLLQQRFSGQIPELLRGLLLVGLLGGFTTFSAFSLETLQLMQIGLWSKAMLNIILSVAACLFAVFAGAGLGRIFA